MFAVIDLIARKLTKGHKILIIAICNNFLITWLATILSCTSFLRIYAFIKNPCPSYINVVSICLLTHFGFAAQQMHGQHHVQFSQPLGAQQLQSRQLTSAAMQHMSPNQMNQGNQLNRQLNQFSSPANSALFNAAQATPTSQMVRYLLPFCCTILHFPFPNQLLTVLTFS